MLIKIVEKSQSVNNSQEIIEERVPKTLTSYEWI